MRALTNSSRNRCGHWLVFALATIGLLSIGSCSDDFDVQWEKQGYSTIQVRLRNSSAAAFSVYGDGRVASVGAGESWVVGRHTSMMSTGRAYIVELSRETKLARFSYRVLRYPDREGQTQEVTITVTEPAPNELSVTTTHTSWIEITDLDVANVMNLRRDF